MENKALNDIQEALLNGQLTVEELVNHYLEKAKAYSSFNAYVELFEGKILEASAKLQYKINHTPENLGPLFGAVVSVKDNICIKDHVVSAASKMLEDYVSPFSATVVERIIQADALIIGRTNCDEFSMGSSNKSSVYGPVRNAMDPSRIPGGSSGGAAVSVALDSCLMALGSDTGGSIRQPAAFNGLVGFKPSYGCLSRWGLIAYASSFDQIGVIARHPDDVSSIMKVMSGPDENDAKLYNNPVSFDQGDEFGFSDMAYFEDLFDKTMLTERVWQRSHEVLEMIGKKMSKLDVLSFPDREWLVPCYYIIACAEASSNLARYDGIRYGFSKEGLYDSFKEKMIANRSDSFGKEVKKRIILGNYVLSEGYYDAYFKKALEVRTYFKKQLAEILDQFDFVFLPATPDVAWKLEDKAIDSIEVYKADVFTTIANITGLPSVTIPINNKCDELPFGIQVLTKEKNDGALLALAQRLSKLL